MSLRDEEATLQTLSSLPASPTLPPTETTHLLPASARPLPFRQDLLWASLSLSFFSFMCATLLAFLLSPRFQTFVILHANALFTVPYVISFIVILACLAPWAPASLAASSLGQMNAGVIASPADFLLVFLVLIEWAMCLALMLVTLVSIHEGMSFISADGLIVPRGGAGGGEAARGEAPQAGGIPSNSPVILVVPLLTLYALFNTLIHLASCVEAVVRQRRGAAV